MLKIQLLEIKIYKKKKKIQHFFFHEEGNKEIAKYLIN